MTDIKSILNTTTKAIRPTKQLAQTAAKKEVLGQAVQTAKAAIKTVLVASYGWPTEATQLPRKQAAKR